MRKRWEREIVIRSRPTVHGYQLLEVSQSQSQQLMDQSIKHHMLSLCTLSDLQNRFGKTHLACTDMDPWANTGQTADLLFVV